MIQIQGRKPTDPNTCSLLERKRDVRETETLENFETMGLTKNVTDGDTETESTKSVALFPPLVLS
jgi:hypothetical protein